MRYYLFITGFLLLIHAESTKAQTIVFDPAHFAIVNENGAVRLAAENTHNNYLNTICNRLDDINLNISSVILVQTLIHNSLTQVNQALKSGIAAAQVAQISAEIVRESNTMIEIAGSEPYLLLFAEDVARQMKSRGINLVSEVSAFVLKEGSNILMDYEKRDALLRKVILELKVMRALCYSMGRSMYWAKMNGVLKTANPYRDFINQDTRKAEEIIFNYHLFKE
ncbi:hypothetical protein BDE36_1302 [Arcticibacter tournemirensis]|uniref:Plasmid transfer protein n=1 Tax=Arcticibacter tournemirensis TaxID=699437 RepID=A0A5M9GQP4_9SPHI|nr:hypothetical protein [Arcticibacter tournemirensis]KAA8476846.1 hypothetical protein F1649_19415 [Arcticibacter tournemirensis]TQM49583.1 hypothetical protein BDE36_1302 [Arcticibacter tournemirensis]